MKKNNPHEVLGVNKEASEEDIKKAFKSLALKYHPDKAGTEDERKTNEEKFKELNEAYQSLVSRSDSDFNINDILEKLRNTGFSGFTPFGGFEDFFANRKEAKEEVVSLELKLKDILKGLSIQFRRIVDVKCDECKGEPFTNKSMCEVCDGKGMIERSTQKSGMFFVSRNMCSNCMGRGFTAEKTCSFCKGAGTQKKIASLHVKIKGEEIHD